MSLQEQIEKRRKEIYSDRLSMSIGELAGLYERIELDTHPKFQRFLRWSDEQKTKLIESIILRIPVPPIFVAQDLNGLWDVVDGVQRLGTIFEFLGILRDPDGGIKIPLTLTQTKLLPELKSKVFNDRHRPQCSFTTSQQLDFKRSRLDIHIILKESDPSAKYELFERLNTGGSLASAQEVRNCVLVWINEGFFDWMHTLHANENFSECVELSERLEIEQYRMEILLRFLVFRRLADAQLAHLSLDDLAEYLNEQNRQLASDTKFNMKAEEAVFADTFKLINDAVGANAFRKYDKQNQRFRGSFLISAFEAVALGVAQNVNAWKNDALASTKIEALIKSMWSDTNFIEHIGIGFPARARIKKSIPYGRSHFVP